MKLFSHLIILFVFLLAGNTQAQNFTVIDTLPKGAYGNAAWGDMDGDGMKDLVYITQAVPDAICKVYRSDGKRLTEVKQHFPGMYNAGVCWADLNNDGFDDLVVNGMDSVLVQRTFVYKSLGNGSFVSIPNSIFPLSAGAIDIADYNKDGLKDIAVTGMDSVGGHHAYIYKNTGGFQFSKIKTGLRGIHFGELKWGDYNNDQLPDLVINGIGDNEFRAHIYKNMGGDSFSMLPNYMMGSGGTADWCDMDKDGWQDILVTGYDSTSGHNFTQLHHNNHDGTFSVANTNLPAFGEPSAVAIADFDLDGHEDICMAGGNDAFPSTGSAMATGNGSNNFTLSAFFHSDVTNTIAETGDMDHDGDADLIISNFILRNDTKAAGVNPLPSGQNEISIYPNPANDRLFIQGISAIASVSIYNLSGQEMCTIHPIAGNKLTLPELKSSMYVLKITSADGKEYFRKLMIEQ